jgi:glucarate dehydratase
MQPMKVVELDLTPVYGTLRHSYKSSRVLEGVGIRNIVVRLKTDSGLVGWGESSGLADPGSVAEALVAMRPFVIGRDPWDNEAIARDVYRRGLWDYRLPTANLAYAGIDMALWDLCGKDCGKPIHRLFGGPVREEVDYFFFLASGTPDEIAEQCAEGARGGYTCYYMKVGLDTAAEEEMLAAARRTLGARAKLRVDANEAWSLADAIQILDRWHRLFTIDFAEAPVRAYPETLMQHLRQATPVALCANEGLAGEADVLRTIDAQAASVLCFSSYWVGTLRRFHTLAQVAHLKGIGTCKHTHGEFGIGAAAAHHILLTLAGTVDGGQQTAAIMVDDLLTEALPIATGPRWGVIDAPGLGVEVDQEKLRRLSDDYHRTGRFLAYNLGQPQVGEGNTERGHTPGADGAASQ